MFVLDVLGWTLCRCLRLRLVLPVSSGSLRRPPAQLYTDSASVQTFIRHQRVDVDYCDDDDDNDASDYDDAESSRFDSVRRHSAATPARRHDSSSVGASGCSASGIEFKYSETNV